MVKPLQWAVILVIGLFSSLIARDEIFEYEIFVFEDYLTVSFDFSSLLTPEYLKNIREGYPVHIKLSAKLKKHVPLWSDNQISEYTSYAHIEYASFGSRYKLKILNFMDSLVEMSIKSEADLIENFNEQLLLQAEKLHKLKNKDLLYFSFNLEQKNLSIEELNHASNWYRGKSGDSTKPDSNSDLSRVFNYLLSLSGHGSINYDLKSYLFRPSEIKKIVD